MLLTSLWRLGQWRERWASVTSVIWIKQKTESKLYPKGGGGISPFNLLIPLMWSVECVECFDLKNTHFPADLCTMYVFARWGEHGSAYQNTFLEVHLLQVVTALKNKLESWDLTHVIVATCEKGPLPHRNLIHGISNWKPPHLYAITDSEIEIQGSEEQISRPPQTNSDIHSH